MVLFVKVSDSSFAVTLKYVETNRRNLYKNRKVITNVEVH